MKKCEYANYHSEWGKNQSHCIMCRRKIGKTFKEKLKEKVDNISIETKQKFLDLLHEGKTVGEAEKETGINETIVSGEIVMQNIITDSFSY